MRAQSTNGVTRHGRGERLASSRCRRVGLRHRGRRSAPLSGSFTRRRALGRSAGTRLICHVGPTKNTKTQITQSRRNRIGLLRTSMVVCCRSGRVSQQRALSAGGAAVSGAFDQRGQIATRAVGEGHVLNGSPGHVDSDDAGSAVGAPSHSGAAVARGGDRPCTVRRSGCSGTGAIARSPGAGGSNHQARLAPPGHVITESGRGCRWRARAATRVIQHAVPPSRGRRAGSIHERGHAARSR